MKITRRTTTRRTPPALDAVKSRLRAPEWDRRRKAQADGDTLGSTEGISEQRDDRPVESRSIPEQRGEPCPKCGATAITLEPCTTGPHHAARRCRKCRKFRGWAPHPVSYPDACAYRLAFGRHKGRSLAEIDAADAGVQYLLWALGIDALDCKSRRHILRYLKGPS